MNNDLPPESQPWVREVEGANVSNATALESIRTNAVAQQATTEAALATVEARIRESKGRASTLGKFTSSYNQLAIGAIKTVSDQWSTLYEGIVLSPDGATMNARFFAMGSLTYNHSGNAAPGRFRVLVNGSASTGTVALAYSGSNFAQSIHAGELTAVKRITISLQMKTTATNFTNPTGSYENRARYSLAVSWS